VLLRSLASGSEWQRRRLHATSFISAFAAVAVAAAAAATVIEDNNCDDDLISASSEYAMSNGNGCRSHCYADCGGSR